MAHAQDQPVRLIPLLYFSARGDAHTSLFPAHRLCFLSEGTISAMVNHGRYAHALRTTYAVIAPLHNIRSLILYLLLLTACSSMPTTQPSLSGTGASPGQATVYFYRLHSSPGGVVGVDLKDNGIDIGTLQDGTYFVYHANPGVHALTATTDTASTQNFTLQGWCCRGP
jgi:hypothetical protein